MNFPDSYFEDEVKAGFFVSAKMKSYWAMQLEVLNEIRSEERRVGKECR